MIFSVLKLFRKFRLLISVKRLRRVFTVILIRCKLLFLLKYCRKLLKVVRVMFSKNRAGRRLRRHRYDRCLSFQRRLCD